MRLRRTIAAASVVLAAGATTAAYDAYSSNRIPAYALSPVDELPPEITQGEGGLVCARESAPCTAITALGSMASSTQISVKLSEISPTVQQAVIDTEDKRFRGHVGCDVPGIARALQHNTFSIIAKKLNISDGPVALQGASTIDRQTASLIYPPCFRRNTAA